MKAWIAAPMFLGFATGGCGGGGSTGPLNRLPLAPGRFLYFDRDNRPTMEPIAEGVQWRSSEHFHSIAYSIRTGLVSVSIIAMSGVRVELWTEGKRIQTVSYSHKELGATARDPNFPEPWSDLASTFSADGRYLATYISVGGSRGNLQLFELSTDRKMRLRKSWRLALFSEPRLSFSPDDSILMLCDANDPAEALLFDVREMGALTKPAFPKQDLPLSLRSGSRAIVGRPNDEQGGRITVLEVFDLDLDSGKARGLQTVTIPPTTFVNPKPSLAGFYVYELSLLTDELISGEWVHHPRIAYDLEAGRLYRLPIKAPSGIWIPN